jgi:predicted protein tyrosine phosphatase
VPPLVPYKITICGLTELCEHAAAGISHVLTIIDPDHPDPKDFTSYGPHARTVWRFHDIIKPAEGQVHPTEDSVRRVLEFGEAAKRQPIDHLLVHCHMGMSRSTAAAVILMVQDNPGRETDAFEHLAEIRPYTWPNSLMLRHADALLRREGVLLEAMRRHHVRMARAYPNLAALLRGGERDAEVPKDIG